VAAGAIDCCFLISSLNIITSSIIISCGYRSTDLDSTTGTMAPSILECHTCELSATATTTRRCRRWHSATSVASFTH